MVHVCHQDGSQFSPFHQCTQNRPMTNPAALSACFRLVLFSHCFCALCRSGFSRRHVFNRSYLASACFPLYRFLCSFVLLRIFLCSTSLLSPHCSAWLNFPKDGLNGFRSTTTFYTLWLQYGSNECFNTSFNMFQLPTWVGKYNLFINAFKVRGILNSL